MDIGNNAKVSLPSGAELEMTLAPFLEGRKLSKAIANCLKNINVDSNTELEANINTLKDVFVECLTSQEVEDSILLCLKRCTYNKQRVTSWDIFEDANARQDYIPVCWEVCKFNLAPFMKSLFAKLSTYLGQTGTTPK